jgi:RNase P subunit RPR2
MKVGTDREMPPSACTNCRYVMDMATSISERDDDPQPEPGAFTICIQCGHIMRFADDLSLRDLTDEEIVMVAGDKRIIAIQAARAEVERERAYVEDRVRAAAKKKNQWLTHENVNDLVDQALKLIPKAAALRMAAR